MYCEEDFEWDNCRKLAARDMDEANVRLLRGRAEEAFQRAASAQPRQEGTSADDRPDS